jgi:hypothetical protein
MTTAKETGTSERKKTPGDPEGYPALVPRRCAMNDQPKEFDCVDCGRHIVRWGPPDDPRCAECLHVPGWYREPELAGQLVADE